MQETNLTQKIETFLAGKPIILQILRFAAIGIINTALDFAVLNFVSKTLGITAGLSLGSVNAIGFGLAVIQSYFWNKYWTFGTDTTIGLFKNFLRLVLVGALGSIVMLTVLIGSKYEVSSLVYLFAVIFLVVGELGIWFTQDIGISSQPAWSGLQFANFLIVSVIGLVINSVIVAVLSASLASSSMFASDQDLVKNVAKIIATFASLAWNFVGYKLLVFKR